MRLISDETLLLIDSFLPGAAVKTRLALRQSSWPFTLWVDQFGRSAAASGQQ